MGGEANSPDAIFRTGLRYIRHGLFCDFNLWRAQTYLYQLPVFRLQEQHLQTLLVLRGILGLSRTSLRELQEVALLHYCYLGFISCQPI